ncbi:ATP-dependent zinc metalloprotease FtsH [Rhodohalobacter halophilus]|uniref:ATP-dependent zinc metalloprotease FtsH n=1 Tax=Rhodohalobacter halophilus TaxID=1812810 RepID=UPI00083FD866|nr:ATP-dependent zinc metalloprotease FtsH [Rhodohalobacter halophilus]
MKRPTGTIYWIYLFLFVMLGYWVLTDSGGLFGSQAEIEYSTFKQQLRSDNIESVHIQGDRIRGEFRESQVLNRTEADTTSHKNFVTVIPSFGDEGLSSLLEENDVVITAESDSDGFWWYFLIFSMPLFFLLIIGYMFYRRMQMQGRGMFNIGKSQAKLQEPGKNKTTFDNVAGMDGAKTELREIIEFLKDPKRFEEIGAKLPKGVLLMGPPGTGKTLLARAVAGEAGVPFFTITGSDFMEMFVGVGAKRVREMFKQAKEKSPAIIFIDEIDSIGRKRGAGVGGGHDEREQTLNQLLAELDGFEPSENVIVMAATNRPDILDPALLRPGRFDRQITVDLPSQNSRHEILKIHAKNKTIDESVNLDKIARSTPGFSGADLENLLNEASLYAGRNKRRKIIMDDIENARDKIMMGLEREGMQIDDDEKKILAYHEAGHAIVAAALPNSDPLHKVSVIPRGKAMGQTMQLPEKEKYLYNKEYLLDRMAVIMGGRAAEQLIFNTATSGAQNDLMRVAKLSRKMVVEWGMSDKFGHLAFGSDEEDVFLGRDMTRQKSYSDATAREIDEEVQEISREAYERAVKILQKHKDAFDQLAELLIEKEEVSGEEVLKLMKKDQDSD